MAVNDIRLAETLIPAILIKDQSVLSRNTRLICNVLSPKTNQIVMSLVLTQDERAMSSVPTR